MRDYLATEVALDHAEGHLTRREALQRLGYETACEFAGFPGGVVKYVMRKSLI